MQKCEVFNFNTCRFWKDHEVDFVQWLTNEGGEVAVLGKISDDFTLQIPTYNNYIDMYDFFFNTL
jgi:hypothetical protein